MSFPNMSDMAAALPTTSQWTRTPTPIGPQSQPTNLEEFVEAYARWQHTYALSPALAGPPPNMPMMPIQQPSPRSTAQFAIPRSTPTPSSGSSSPSRYTPTPPTVRIPTSPLRRQRTTLIQPIRPLTTPATPAPASAIAHQVPIPTSNGKIGKSIAAKPEMFDGSKEKFLQWWRTMVFYLMGFENAPNDVQQIMIVLSYMRGDNAAGRFADLYAQGGVPMDISKARAEGKCFRCGDPWPCAKHFKPRARQIRSFQYRGVNIEYTTAEELEAAITKAEKDFPNGQ